jgi:hypothetical protein
MSYKTKFISAILIMAVVSSGITPFIGNNINPVQKANAQTVQEVDNTCKLEIAAATFLLSGGNNNPGSALSDTIRKCIGKKENVDNTNDTVLHASLEDSALSMRVRNKLFLDTINNEIRKTEYIALIEGKNAYVNALSNGSTEPVAREEAFRAVNETFSKVEVQVINSWNIYLRNLHSDWTFENESLESKTLYDLYSDPSNLGSNTGNDIANIAKKDGFKLSNGTMVKTLKWTYYSNETEATNTNNWAGIDYGYSGAGSAGNSGYGLGFEKTNGNHIKLPARNTTIGNNSYWDTFETIEQKRNSVINNLRITINQTYDAWKNEKIDESDFIDPYLAARNMDKNASFSNWASVQLSIMEGVGLPENMSKIGYFKIEDKTDNNTYQGILLSASNPDSGAFETGNTYNASKINGPQFISLDNEIHELEGKFTIKEIVTNDGESINKTVIKKVNYTTTNYEEYKNSTRNLQEFIAALEASQTSGAGGGNTGNNINLGILNNKFMGIPYWIFLVGGIVIAMLFGRN